MFLDQGNFVEEEKKEKKNSTHSAILHLVIGFCFAAVIIQIYPL